MNFLNIFRNKSSPFYYHWTGHFSFAHARFSKIMMIFIGILLLSLYLLFHVFHVIYYNGTASAPRGFYMAVPSGIYKLTHGDFVIIECPKDYPPLASKKQLLLKEIQGFPNETYVITDTALIINNKKFLIYHDASYLPQLPEGTFIIPENNYLLLNPMPYSFDSRYMGTIPEQFIKKKVILILNTDFMIQKLTDIWRQLS